MVVAVAALVVALGGTASAAFGPLRGDTLIKKHSLSGNRLKNHTISGAQVNLSRLGKVPNATTADTATHATSADTATNATTATNAGHATDSDQLGGSPKSSFQSRVTGTCEGNSGVTRVNADGSVACANVRFYSGRLVEPLNGGDTFLTIPGVAHVISLNCQAANANAALINDPPRTTDVWTGGDTVGSVTSYLGTNWFESNTALAATGAAVWHLGQGSGSGAKVITVTVNTEATGSNCIFQGTAEVITTS
jgi:hypothetical protein